MKNRKGLYFYLTAASAIMVSGAIFSLDIPLTGGGAGEGQRIAYVDMDQIFEIFPQTRYAKEDYMDRLGKKKEAIQAKEEAVSDLKARIQVLESTLAGVEGSSETLPAQPAGSPSSVDALKAELQTKMADLEDEKNLAREELETFQSQQSEIILGKIYQALKTLAEERQVNLVVDKSSILFGSTEIDLTQDLQERVRGY